MIFTIGFIIVLVSALVGAINEKYQWSRRLDKLTFCTFVAGVCIFYSKSYFG